MTEQERLDNDGLRERRKSNSPRRQEQRRQSMTNPEVSNYQDRFGTVTKKHKNNELVCSLNCPY